MQYLKTVFFFTFPVLNGILFTVQVSERYFFAAQLSNEKDSEKDRIRQVNSKLNSLKNLTFVVRK